MDSAITQSTSLPLQMGQSRYTFQEQSEFSQRESAVKADGSVQTRVEYAQHRSAYVLNFNSSEEYRVNQSLTYTRLSSYQSVESGPLEPDTTASSELSSLNQAATVDSDNSLLAGASTILKFVEQRIAAEKAAGTSEGELAEIWEQGLKGFVQGFNEAVDILEAAGQMKGGVSEQVTLLADQVYAGFDKIYANYIADPNESGVPVADSESTVLPINSAPVATMATAPRQFLSSNNEEGALSAALKSIGSQRDSAISQLVSQLDDVAHAQVEYARKDRFQFELTTLDGDKIRINASNTTAFYGEYTDADSEVFAEGMKDKNHFKMDISGELDDAERAAINDLLQQIMDLADEFYNGDIDKAYQAAMDLGYDQNEIASYSLKLRQVEHFSVAAQYQQASQDVIPESREALSTIGDFAQSVLESLYNPENYAFFDYTQLLRGISEQIDQQLRPLDLPRFSDIVAQISDVAAPTQEDSADSTALA